MHTGSKCSTKMAKNDLQRQKKYILTQLATGTWVVGTLMILGAREKAWMSNMNCYKCTTTALACTGRWFAVRSLIRVMATTDIKNGEEFFVDYENVNAVAPVTQIRATGTKRSFTWQGKCGRETSPFPLEWDWVKANCVPAVIQTCVDVKLNTWQIFVQREGPTNPRAYWNGVSL